jgi:uncharacterized membrane protein
LLFFFLLAGNVLARQGIKKKKSEGIVSKNNDGERETSQMKIKIKLHGAIFALPW